jgi:hypothetical protein
MESASTGSTKLDRNSTGSTGSTGKASTAPVDSASTQCLDGASEPRQLWTAHGSTARAQRAPRHACPHQCTRRCTQNVFARSSTVCTHLDINYIRGKIRPERTIRAPRPPSARCRVHARIPTRPSNDKLGVSKKGRSPLDLPPGLIRTVLSSREPPRAQISIK